MRRKLLWAVSVATAVIGAAAYILNNKESENSVHGSDDNDDCKRGDFVVDNLTFVSDPYNNEPIDEEDAVNVAKLFDKLGVIEETVVTIHYATAGEEDCLRDIILNTGSTFDDNYPIYFACPDLDYYVWTDGMGNLRGICVNSSLIVCEEVRLTNE